MEEELREYLRQLLTEVRGQSAEINHGPSLAASEANMETIPLLGDARLCVQGSHEQTPTELQAAMKRTAHKLIACVQRWGALPMPAIRVTHRSPRHRALTQIHTYLLALTNCQHCANAALTINGNLVSSAHALTDLQQARVPFILRQLRAAVAREKGKTSHAELVNEDTFVTAFWFGAALIVFFTEDYAVDFVRHRVRLVTRELAGILPFLDDPPRDPAQVQTIPE